MAHPSAASRRSAGYGTADLAAIEDRGGITIIQDPAEAQAPSMPLSAAAQVPIDYCRPLADTGPLLADLAKDPPPEVPAPQTQALEMGSIVGQEAAMVDAGLQSPLALTCPECGAALQEVRAGRVRRFRCPLGHAYSPKTLLSELSLAREDALWSALRAIREEASLAQHLSASAGSADAWPGFLRDLADRLRGRRSNRQRPRRLG